MGLSGIAVRLRQTRYGACSQALPGNANIRSIYHVHRYY